MVGLMVASSSTTTTTAPTTATASSVDHHDATSRSVVSSSPPADSTVLKERTNNTHVCFVTSIFAASLDTADQPPRADIVFQNETSPVDFFLFTNLADIPAVGWTKILKTDFTYRRYITQSRYGKFLAWQEPQLSHCATIVYFDGYLRPRKKNWASFRDLFDEIAESPSGLAQVAHPMFNGWDMKDIFKNLVHSEKDIATNANASLSWLNQQPDYTSNYTYYLNKYFGKFSWLILWFWLLVACVRRIQRLTSLLFPSLAYDPSNLRYREASTFFWDRYSRELDSWRDQPLWSYCLYHFNITPLVFTDAGRILDGGDMFVSVSKLMGFRGHRYSNATDSDALAPTRTRA